jgi:hypothetical protein
MEKPDWQGRPWTEVVLYETMSEPLGVFAVHGRITRLKELG